MEAEILFSKLTNYKKDPPPKRVGFFYVLTKGKRLKVKGVRFSGKGNKTV